MTAPTPPRRFRARCWVAKTLRRRLPYRGAEFLRADAPPAVQLHLGAVLGVVDLDDAHMATSDDCDCDGPWAETTYTQADGTLRTDVAHLTLANPVELEQPLYTTSVKGGLGLRRPTPDLVAELAEALR